MSNAFDKASLVMLPHAYEEGKLYSLKPTDRSGDFTFSRGTDTATRVGEDGYIKKEYSNVLEQSNNFNTTWFTANTTPTGGQTGYDGSLNAWLLQAASTSTSARIEQTVSSGLSTYSVYAKEGTTSFLALRTNDSTTVSWFDLSGSGSVTKGTNAIDAVITPISNGWFRCSISFASCSSVRFYIGDAAGYPVTGGANVYIQDAQLNPGLVAYPYLETTTAPVYGGLTDDMPRLDYSGGATCPSLLLEPSRTNLITHSEYFSDSYYIKDSGISTIENQLLSPEGFLNACKVSVSNNNRIYANNTSGTYIFSFFIKAGTFSHFRIFGQNIDLTTSPISVGSLDFEDYGNGWYRIYYSYTGNRGFQIQAYPDNTYSTHTTSGDYYLYGHQIEAGSYPTSYIPTYGSSQTRAYDNSTLLNIDTNIVDITGDFTFYLDNTGSLMKGTELYYYFIELYWDAITSIRYYSTSNGSWYYKPSNAYYGFNNSVGKQVIKYQNGVFYHFLNGTKSPSTGTMAVTNSLSKIQFFANTTGKAGYLNIKQALLFDSALSDSECIALTQL